MVSDLQFHYFSCGATRCEWEIKNVRFSSVRALLGQDKNWMFTIKSQHFTYSFNNQIAVMKSLHTVNLEYFNIKE